MTNLYIANKSITISGMRKEILFALTLLTLPMTACAAEDNLQALEAKCEAAYESWTVEQPVPGACYEHLRELRNRGLHRDAFDGKHVEELDEHYRTHYEIAQELAAKCSKDNQGYYPNPEPESCQRKREYIQEMGIYPTLR